MNIKIKEILAEVKKKGFNIYSMINTYKKRSRISVEIPEEVIYSVAECYLNSPPKKDDFGYFLKVLELQTKSHFSKQNEEESKSRAKEKRGGFAPSIAQILGMK